MTTQTKPDIVARLSEIQTERLAWLDVIQFPDDEQPDAMVRPDIFDNRGFRCVTSRITNLIFELDSYVTSMDFTPDAYEIILQVDIMLDEWSIWADNLNQIAAGEHDENSRPDAKGCWDAFDAVLLKIPDPTYKQVESIGMLMSEQGISLTQVAKIYGWELPDGSPDTIKVQEEIAEPGKHYKPASWENPEVKLRQRRFAKRWESREPAKQIDKSTFAKTDPESQAREWVNPGIAPEPVEQLLRLPGMLVEQVAKMKQMTVEEVKEIAYSNKIAIDHSAVKAIDEDVADDPLFPFQTLEHINNEIAKNHNRSVKTYPEKGNLPGQVLAMIQDDGDMADKLIVEAIRGQHPAANEKVVAEIRKAYKELADSIGMAKPAAHPSQAPISDDNPVDTKVAATIDAMGRAELFELSKGANLGLPGNTKTVDLKAAVLSHISQPMGS